MYTGITGKHSRCGGESPGEDWEEGLTLPTLSLQWAEQGCEHFVCSSGKWSACLLLCPAVCPWARRSTSLGPGYLSNEPGQTSPVAPVWNSRGRQVVPQGGVQSPEVGDERSPSGSQALLP